jgi:hypothetical protein
MGVTYPALAEVRGSGLAISYVAPHSAATLMTHDIISRRMRQSLRFERGLVYDIDSDYQHVGAGDILLVFATDCRPGDTEAVTSTTLQIVDDLRAHGASPEEIRRASAAGFAQTTARDSHRGHLARAAADELLGRDHRPPDQVAATYAAVTPEDITVAARRILNTLMVAIPPGTYDSPRLAWYPTVSTMAVEGRIVRRSGWRTRLDPKDGLIIGPTGLSLFWPYDRYVSIYLTVRYEDCVAIRHLPGPTRVLWGADGFSITIRADEWSDGRKLIDEIDAAIPRDRVACDEHGIGALIVPN